MQLSLHVCASSPPLCRTSICAATAVDSFVSCSLYVYLLEERSPFGELEIASPTSKHGLICAEVREVWHGRQGLHGCTSDCLPGTEGSSRQKSSKIRSSSCALGASSCGRRKRRKPFHLARGDLRNTLVGLAYTVSATCTSFMRLGGRRRVSSASEAVRQQRSRAVGSGVLQDRGIRE